jgi:hypothetical protein
LSWGDARAAWTGTAPEFPGVPLRVEAAVYRGRPTFFVIAAPWTPKPGVAPTRRAAWQTLIAGIVLAIVLAPLGAGVLMARWSIKSGRADRRGAARLTTAVALAQLAATWLVMAHYGGTQEIALLLQALVLPFGAAILVWTLYVGLEPYVRRTWPSALVSWNRIVEGRIRDARVARDVLVGLAATGLFSALDPLLAQFMPIPPRGLDDNAWAAASGLRSAIGDAIGRATLSIMLSLALLILLCLVRMAVKRDRIASIGFAVTVAVMIVGSYAAAFRQPAGALFVVAYGAIYGAVWAVLLVRFGLMTFIAHQASDSLLSGVVTNNAPAWHAGSSLLNLGDRRLDRLHRMGVSARADAELGFAAEHSTINGCPTAAGLDVRQFGCAHCRPERCEKRVSRGTKPGLAFVSERIPIR